MKKDYEKTITRKSHVEFRKAEKQLRYSARKLQFWLKLSRRRISRRRMRNYVFGAGSIMDLQPAKLDGLIQAVRKRLEASELTSKCRRIRVYVYKSSEVEDDQELLIQAGTAIFSCKSGPGGEVVITEEKAPINRLLSRCASSADSEVEDQQNAR